MIRLDSWRDGGCPILNYAIHNRKEDAQDWEVEETNIDNVQRSYYIHSLVPDTQYHIQVTAVNIAGESTAQYRYTTLYNPKREYFKILYFSLVEDKKP